MKTTAFIPLRGGSKSIPLKNIKNFAGKPLAYWTIEAALNCQTIDEVIVSTDSDAIKQCIEKLNSQKIKVVSRSSSTATDTASTESVLLEFLEKNPCENVVLIQATSPLLTSTELESALQKYFNENYDSLLSVVRQKRFLWDEKNEHAQPLNYDYKKRPRRQDCKGFLVENGAFYISHRTKILQSGCRLSGKIGLYEMPENTYFELDEPTDWLIMENLLKIQLAFAKKLQPEIKFVFTDVDGVLTDSGMYYAQDGNELKKFNTRDGVGFNLLSQAGIKTGIITSENTAIVENRGRKLRVDYVFQGVKDKFAYIQNFCLEQNINLSQIAYIGDDINDTKLLSEVGLAATPCNAISANLAVADYICERKGGEGCFREFVEYILEKI